MSSIINGAGRNIPDLLRAVWKWGQELWVVGSLGILLPPSLRMAALERKNTNERQIDSDTVLEIRPQLVSNF